MPSYKNSGPKLCFREVVELESRLLLLTLPAVTEPNSMTNGRLNGQLVTPKGTTIFKVTVIVAEPKKCSDWLSCITHLTSQ